MIEKTVAELKVGQLPLDKLIKRARKSKTASLGILVDPDRDPMYVLGSHRYKRYAKQRGTGPLVRP